MTRRFWAELALVTLVLAVSGVLPAQAARERFAPYRDGRVFYLDQGLGETVLVLIHGWGADHEVWENQAPRLAEEFRVLSLDLPGHGKSDKPETDYTQDYLAEAITAVLDDAGVDRVVIAGHSMGCCGGPGLCPGPSGPDQRLYQR